MYSLLKDEASATTWQINHLICHVCAEYTSQNVVVLIWMLFEGSIERTFLLWSCFDGAPPHPHTMLRRDQYAAWRFVWAEVSRLYRPVLPLKGRSSFYPFPLHPRQRQRYWYLMCHVNWLWAPMWTHLGPTYIPPSFQLSCLSSDTPGPLTPSICTSPSVAALKKPSSECKGVRSLAEVVSGQPEPQLICLMNGSDGFSMGGAVVVKSGRNFVEM